MCRDGSNDRDVFTVEYSPDGLTVSGPPADRYEFLKLLDEALRAKLEEKGTDLSKANYTFLRISRECGCTVDYRQPEDVPLYDIYCEHGNLLLAWREEVTDCKLEAQLEEV